MEHILGDAGMAAHADADDRHLDDIGIGLQRVEAERLAATLENLHGAVEIGARDRESQVGFAVRGDILHDHVDVDCVVGERAEDRRRHAGPVGDALYGDLRFVAAVSDAADHPFFHDLILVDYERPGRVGKAR